MNLIDLDFFASPPEVLKLISTLRCLTLKDSPKWGFDHKNIILIGVGWKEDSFIYEVPIPTKFGKVPFFTKFGLVKFGWAKTSCLLVD